MGKETKSSGAPAVILSSRLRAGEKLFMSWCGFTTLRRRKPRRARASTPRWSTCSMAWSISRIRCRRSRWSGWSASRRSCACRSAISRRRRAHVGRQPAGIVAPMVNSAADAGIRELRGNFPPVGERSWGPQRAGAGRRRRRAYLKRANDIHVAIAMIETRRRWRRSTMRSSIRPASTACSSAPPTSRSRSPMARRSTRSIRKWKRRSITFQRAAGPNKDRRPVLHDRRARQGNVGARIQSLFRIHRWRDDAARRPDGTEGGARLKTGREDERPRQARFFEMRRLETLSNTVFGVAMTLLLA